MLAMEQRLFVERFLVAADAEQARPPGVRYDPLVRLTVGPDGKSFVESADPAATATETKAFPGDRDRATTPPVEMTSTGRDKPEPRPPGEETAVHRDRPRSSGQLIELWTDTSTRRDPPENTDTVRRHMETRVRRDPPYEPRPQRKP